MKSRKLRNVAKKTANGSRMRVAKSRGNTQVIFGAGIFATFDLDFNDDVTGQVKVEMLDFSGLIRQNRDIEQQHMF